MRLSRFFKFIQSANSVIIFTGGILLLSVLVYAVYHIARDVFGEKEIYGVVSMGAPCV